MTEDELALVWFDYNDFSFSKTEKILKIFDKSSDIFNKNIVKSAIFDNINIPNIKEKLLEIDLEKFKNQIDDEFYKYNISAITFISKGYPEKLKNIDEPPLVLYTRGDTALLTKKSISIVGTRKPSDYGKIITEKWTKELSRAGLVTVSGLAYGTDTLVAEATLGCGGKTIAVLAGGLDSIYPYQNKDLAERVSKNGLLLSEYRPKVKPTNYSFVTRNRIVSALGLGTVIVEAGEKSGTMTTARHSIEQGRELFVVPGNIGSPTSAGTNKLIDEIPDTFTISTERILSRLGIQKKETKETSVQLDITERQIIDALSGGGLSFDDIADATGISAAVLSSKLIKMEMFGVVKKGNGNIYYVI